MSTGTAAIQHPDSPWIERAIYDIRIRLLLEQALKHRDSIAAHALLDRARHVVGIDVERYESARSPNRWLREIEIYVEDHLGARINVCELAAITKFSLSHFHRLFLQRYGITPATYIRARRVQRAQALMMRLDAKLVDIALECGFADQAHLSRVFKRVVGANPRKWRSGCGDCGPGPMSVSSAQ
jgi:transcriptional regulator GlxA family with amidase domain